MKATEFLRKGADLLEERGKQYDQPGGERSMGKTVRAFNTITGRSLSEAEGWLLLQVLKDVRQWQNPDKYHADSAEDCVSYAALKAEALASLAAVLGSGLKSTGDIYADDTHDALGNSEPNEPASAIDDDSVRAKIIGQSGEMAAEVYAAIDGKPLWSEAPKWANWLAQDADGTWDFYSEQPGLEDEYFYPVGADKWWAADPGLCSMQGKPSKYWRETLERRPC